MSKNRQSVKQFTCPACFAREIDVIILHYDEDDQEYYCPRCNYAGKREHVEQFFQNFIEAKYKEMRDPHPFCKGL